MQGKMRKTYILIPSLNPDKGLMDYIKVLQSKGFHDILVIDDGSGEEYSGIFELIEAMDGISVLRHAVNLGKGRALKNGFNYYLNLDNLSEFSGVITVDSDGQHSAEDVKKVAAALDTHPNALVMGCRDFSSGGISVPLKSSLGNRMTCKIFNMLYGVKMKDTQTGLRGFPTEILKSMLQLYGERFEYETNILIEAAIRKIPIVEINIRTIYINDNRGTHFRVVKDSWAIYSLLIKSFFRYICSSLTSFVLDIGLFRLFLYWFKVLGISFGAIAWATFSARVFSSLFNYSLNKNLVFCRESGRSSLVKYYMLSICQMMLSAAMVTMISEIAFIDEVFIKIIVDTALFCISYQIQQRWVF